MLKVDTRGRSCPEPMLMVKKALEENSEIEVLIDSPAARKNIIRYVKDKGHSIEESDLEEEALLKIKK